MTEPQQPDSAKYAATLVALYALAERQLLAGITRILQRTPATLEGLQAAMPQIRRLARQVSARLIYSSNPLAAKMITAAVDEGAKDALEAVGKALERVPAAHRPIIPGADIAPTGGGTPPPPIGKALDASEDDFFDFSMPHGERSANAIRADIESELADVRFRITRLPDDVYKFIAPHGGIYQALANGVTPAQAQAMAWRVFTASGVTGFTDKSGRDWALSSYVEMAVRTAATRAYNASHLARMHAMGVHYFSVPDDGHPCPLCFPWQHRVLTDGVIANPVMHVDGTIAQATAAGLFHPNCKHVLIPVFAGVTVLGEPQTWTPEMNDAYQLTQKQRRLELEVRKAKRALEYAIDPEARKAALADVRKAQKRVREFVAATGLNRQSRREQIDLTDPRIKLPTPIR